MLRSAGSAGLSGRQMCELADVSWLLRNPWGSPMWALPTTLFAVANLVWATSGVAWMQRLPHRYAEDTGRAFDTLPAMLLFVAIALTAAAVLRTTTL